MAPCALSDTSVLTTELPTEPQDADLTDQVHEMVGYLDCMEEALRYLVEQERYPDNHPAVQGLRRHLAEYQQRLVTRVLAKPGS